MLISLESSLVSVSRQTKTKTLAIRIKVEVALLETRIVQFSGQIEMEATHVGPMEVQASLKVAKAKTGILLVLIMPWTTLCL